VPSSGEDQVVARVAPESSIQRGKEAELWLDTAKLHFFDPEGGHSLAASD
jgi:multiple sugar transport system ATP-binding protein